MSKGNLPLNDLASGAGRVDVLIRATMAALLTSHGLRNDVVVVLHLMGGPGPPRRIKFDGSIITGIHAEERSIAGIIKKVIATPLPPIGHWQEVSRGLSHSGGALNTTLNEWKGTPLVALDAQAPRLWSTDARLPATSSSNLPSIDFVLSDDQALDVSELPDAKLRSLGDTWLQGHLAIGIVHFLLDEGVELNLGEAN